MKAGRKLDALVAEKVMGWRRTGETPPGMDCPYQAVPEWWISPDGSAYCAVCSETHPPSYSTELVTAWLVVERLVGPPDYAVAFAVSPWPDGGWMAGFGITDFEGARENGTPITDEFIIGPDRAHWHLYDGFQRVGGSTAHGIDAAHAICLAALEAVGVDVLALPTA